MATITTQTIDELTTDWPSASRQAALTVMAKYGPPHEATDHVLVWYGTGPWKHTLLWREETPHNFPTPHRDVLQQVIDYQVPPERFGDLVAFDGSIVAERTKGELSARGESEEMNFLALNLAHDIVTGATSMDLARVEYTSIAIGFHAGRTHPYVEALQFEVPEGDTGDPDETTMGETMLHDAKAALHRAGRATRVIE